MFNNMKCGKYVMVMLLDSTVIRGNIVKLGADHMVVDDDLDFNEWIFIEFANITGIVVYEEDE